MTDTRKIFWTIRKFTNRRVEAMDYDIHSGEIYLNVAQEIKSTWKLTFVKRAESFGIYLHKLSSNVDNFRVSFSLKCGDQLINKALIQDESSFKDGCGWKDILTVEQALNEADLHNKCLKLKMRLTLIPYEAEDQEEDEEAPNAVGDDYKFFNNKAYSDCTFVSSDNVQVPVHRIILLKQSAQFKTIFDTMTNINTKLFRFPNIDAETMKAVMSFCYTGNAMLNDESLTAKILSAATHFKLKKLKKVCADFLIRHLDTQNVLKLFEMSNKNDVPVLEDKCLTFIISHFCQLKGTEVWTLLDDELKDKVISTLTGYAPIITLESELVSLR